MVKTRLESRISKIESVHKVNFNELIEFDFEMNEETRLKLMRKQKSRVADDIFSNPWF